VVRGPYGPGPPNLVGPHIAESAGAVVSVHADLGVYV